MSKRQQRPEQRESLFYASSLGSVWLVDAWFKWQLAFINQFSDYLIGALEEQPAAVQTWTNFWINIVNVDPHVLAHAVAISETAIALGLIFGVFSNLINFGGALLALVIWTICEGFEGPERRRIRGYRFAGH